MPRFAVMVVLLVAAACGGAGGKATVAQNASAMPATADGQPRRVDLEFTLGNKPFPLPLVHGSVAGVPTLILIDTGANAHIISSWLARKAQLTTKAFGDVGVDHTGHFIETGEPRTPRCASTTGASPRARRCSSPTCPRR